ncbi:unnamed protein product, partial [Allacma fusca]
MSKGLNETNKSKGTAGNANQEEGNNNEGSDGT